MNNITVICQIASFLVFTTIIIIIIIWQMHAGLC